MSSTHNRNFHTASLPFRILAIACVPVLLFVAVHMIMGYFEIYPVLWLKEVHFILQNGLPFFLFLTGSFIANRRLRIPLLICFPLFFIGYALKTLDYWGFIDIYEIFPWLKLKWVICPALLGLIITYTIHFFSKRNKIILDYIKVIWFLAISYITLSIYFKIGFKTMDLYEASTWILLLLMVIGLIKYFKKPIA